MRPDLPDTSTWFTDVVAALFGRSEWKLNELVRNGGGIELPDGQVIRPMRLGRRYHWPAAPIRRALQLDGPDNDDGPGTPPAGTVTDVPETPSHEKGRRRERTG